MSYHAYLKKIFDEKGKFASLDDICLTTKAGMYIFYVVRQFWISNGEPSIFLLQNFLLHKI